MLYHVVQSYGQSFLNNELLFGREAERDKKKNEQLVENYVSSQGKHGK